MPKKKTKQWITIVAPKVFGEKEIGHTLIEEGSEAVGRRLIISAIDVLEDYNKYYLKFSFKISKVENGIAYTAFDGLECTRDYIARMVVRRVRRMDLVIDRETKDGCLLRIKMIAVAGRRIQSGIQKKIRKKMDEIVSERVKQLTLDEFIKEVVSDKFKEEVKNAIKPIYPLRHFEFRKIEVLSGPKQA